jgi:succinate dehydrogenase/fumarate reductase iron-sulfur protein
MRFKVWRSARNGKDGRYETYQVEPRPGMSVLDALFYIRDRYDDSLSFRYSCRGAVCGSCAMTINREPRLACRTQVSQLAKAKSLNLRHFGPLDKQIGWDRSTEVLIEPLPNMPILKDLVVDMTRFFEFYSKTRPWMELPVAQGISKMTPAEVSRIEKYTNCILCAACFGACPVNGRDPDYLGPAALAWSLRFVDDPRTTDKKERLSLVADKNGAPECEFIYNCVKVCPKAVAPAGAIRLLKDHLKA